MKYIPLFELLVLVTMVLVRSAILRHHGIKAIVFGVTNKTDYIIVPIVLFFFYAIVSPFFGWPYPAVLQKPFWDHTVVNICAIAICSITLVWFGVTLSTFGKSFRVGIDTQTTEKLVTNGTFSISRNPIYVAFITFFIGIFLIYPNITSSAFLVIIIATIHRQILREESFLKNHYGEEYEQYCNKVRRYL